MPIEILMPALSPTMTEGTLSKWLVKEGDTVESGDVLAEIETDKATMEVEAVDEGSIGKILVPEGSEGVAVNAPIAVLLEEGEDASAISAVSAPAPAAAPAPATPSEAPAAAPAPSSPTPAPAAPQASGERVFASPLARRMADQAGLDLSQVKGTGPHGRIVKSDIEAAQATGTAKAPPSTSAAASTAASAPAPASEDETLKLFDALEMAYEYQPATRMRKTIARRLQESKQQVPHFYLTIETQIDALLALRKEINAAENVKVSVNDMVILASARSLMARPETNAAWVGEGVASFAHADISVAVATDAGLITPVIRNADTKPLSLISSEMKDLGLRAREGKLKPHEYQGGTFSISNLGMMGVKEFSAVINPPQSMILAVGAGEKRAIVKEDGSLGVATLMSVTLSCDHRVVDGAVGALWLQSFKGFIENPLSMLV